MDSRFLTISTSFLGIALKENKTRVLGCIKGRYFPISLYPARLILFLTTALLVTFLETEKQNLDGTSFLMQILTKKGYF